MSDNEASFIYYTLKYIQLNLDILPKDSGVYKWVYWPNFENTIEDENSFWELLCTYTSKNLAEESNFRDFKFDVTIGASAFKAPNGNVSIPFGLSEAKGNSLRHFLHQKENRHELNRYLKPIIFSNPFYVGKADSLYSRIKDHTSGNSKLLKYIRDQEINQEDIWIGYYVFNDLNNISNNVNNINDVFEEILQRIIKPGLTKRPG